jgi:protein NRD1
MDPNHAAFSAAFVYLPVFSGSYRQARRHLDQQQVFSSRSTHKLQAASHWRACSRYVFTVRTSSTAADNSVQQNGFATQQGTAPVNGHAPQAQNYAAQQVVPPPTNIGATSYYGAPGSNAQAAPPPPVPTVSLQNGAPPTQQPGMMQYSQPVNQAPPTIQYQSNTQAPPQASEQIAPAAQHAPPAAGTTDPQQQLQLLQQLAQILPPEQLAAVIAQMGFQLPAPAAAPVPQVAPQVVAQPPQNGGYDAGQNGYDQGRNNQDNQSRFRDRSRSPDTKRRRVTPPNRRDSPTYGVYDPNVAQSDSGRRGDFERRGDRGRGNRGNRNEFRRRTPPRDRPASPAMVQRPMHQKPPGAPKPVGHDYQIPAGRIKGILFVSLGVVHD